MYCNVLSPLCLFLLSCLITNPWSLTWQINTKPCFLVFFFFLDNTGYTTKANQVCLYCFQEARVKIEKGGSLKLSKNVVTRLQSEFDQDQEASLQTQSDPTPSARRHLKRRDSLISKFFSRKKSEKEIGTFSGQFPPPPAFSDPPVASPVREEEGEHIYSVPSLTTPPRPQSARTSLSQLHILRSRENEKMSNSSATLKPNLKTFLSKTSGSPPTNTKRFTAEKYSPPAFEKCQDRISSPSSPKSVTFFHESEPTSYT